MDHDHDHGMGSGSGGEHDGHGSCPMNMAVSIDHCVSFIIFRVIWKHLFNGIIESSGFWLFSGWVKSERERENLKRNNSIWDLLRNIELNW